MADALLDQSSQCTYRSTNDRKWRIQWSALRKLSNPVNELSRIIGEHPYAPNIARHLQQTSWRLPVDTWTSRRSSE